MFEPLERLDLLDGREVTFTILNVPSRRDVEAFLHAGRGWKGLIDSDELIKNIYADRLISTRPEPQL